MIIDKKVKITSISHDDLVKLFKTGIEGNHRFSIEYDKEFYGELRVKHINGIDLYDKIADTLLYGGKVYIFDDTANGFSHGANSEILDDRTCMYTVDINQIVSRFEDIYNMNTNVDCSDSTYVIDCLEELNDMDGDFDINEADTLIQVILFNEVYYG